MQFHPLPRSPLWPSLRGFLPFRVFNLLAHSGQPLNIVGLAPPLRRLPGCGIGLWTRSVMYHLLWAVISTFMVDLGGYLPWRLEPHTFGSTNYIGGDFPAWLRQLSATYGVPIFALRVLFSAGLVAEVQFSVMMIYHTLAAAGIASGVYIPEEWPDMFRWPVAAMSVTELWGRRWHQQNRVSGGGARLTSDPRSSAWLSGPASMDRGSVLSSSSATLPWLARSYPSRAHSTS